MVYGQNVNAGTTNMIGATDLSNYIKSKNKEILIGLIGSHIQALPNKLWKKRGVLTLVL